MLMRLFFLLLLLLPLSLSASPLPDYSLHYDPARNPFADGRDAIRRATQSQRRILIELGGNWCSWCKRLDHFLQTHPTIKKELHNTFVLLKVNVSEENDNHEFLKVFPAAQGYPHMYVSESNGKLLYSQDTAEFLQSGRYSAKRFKQFFKRWKKASE